ncbi:MAG: panE [Fibrobacteres bacterium]|nr:panE [Fibrobacterota bacterium]
MANQAEKGVPGRSYAILGTGAVGGYYGSLLAKAGRQVRFLVRSDLAHIRAHGLKVDSPKGDFHLEKVDAYASPEEMPACDVAILAWKSTENAHLAGVLPQVLKAGGTVLVLQNGLDPEREAAAVVPDSPILSGLCFLCSRKAGPGWIRHLDYGAITLARYSPAGPMGISAGMRDIGGDLEAAGIEIRYQEDWRTARWRKLVWNVPYNGLCALLGADTAGLMADPGLRALVAEIMDEVIAGAGACGFPMPADFRDRMLEDTDAMAPYEPSMKLDRDARRPMELGAIYGRPLEEIAKAGGRAPAMRALHAELAYIDRSVRRDRR